MDMMIDGEPFWKVALIHSLLNGKVFIEWVSPAVLKAYQWQTSAIEMSLVDMFDIDNSGTRGLSEDSSLPGPNNEVADLIPGLSMVRLGDLPGGVLFGNLEAPFSIMLHNMGRSLPKATAVAINSFQELDTDLTKDLSSKFKNFLNIGPFHLVSKPKPSSKFDEFSCISWLDTQKPRSVAYISFGTMCRLLPDEIVALAETLEDMKTPFLWSLKNDSMKHLPDGFLKRTTANGMGESSTLGTTGAEPRTENRLTAMKTERATEQRIASTSEAQTSMSL
ncbi:hypothetical protein L1887_18408 [Cichorium endivia]|nr:hypothetical protein L1887_18408 [Cichorium endivia]